MASKPIVTVNLWYDRAVMDDVFVGLPGREMQWVFDKRRAFGEAASHLSLVASGADALVGADNADAGRARRARGRGGAFPARAARGSMRGTVIREKHATFSLAPGQPARPGVETPVAGPRSSPATGSKPAFRAQSRARPRPDIWPPPRCQSTIDSCSRQIANRQSVQSQSSVAISMKSVIVHYQEIALKGKNRPWFVARLARNIREATRGSRRRARCASLMGRIELVLGPGRDLGTGRATASARVFGIGNFARAGRAPLDVDAIAAAILERPRRPRTRRRSACRRGAPTSAFR